MDRMMVKKKPAPKKPASKPKKKARPAPLPESPPIPEKTRIYPDEMIIAAIRASHGLVYGASRMVGCPEKTIYNRIKSSEAVREALLSERCKLADAAEENVHQAVVVERDLKTSLWVLERIRRNRYATRTESRIGGDKKAGPIRTEAAINLEDIPLDLRIKLLEALEKKETEDGLQAGETPAETGGASSSEPGLL